MADIDIDLPAAISRERVIQHVYKRFGKLGDGHDLPTSSLRGAPPAREVGKALGFEVTSLRKTFQAGAYVGVADPNDTTDPSFARPASISPIRAWREIFELYKMAQDMPRHLGQHSAHGHLPGATGFGGPLEPAAMPGRVVVQWDKEDCADMGIIKWICSVGMMAVDQDS